MYYRKYTMAPTPARRIPAVFYRTPGAAEIVRDWLRSLDEADRHAIGLDLMRIQFRWPVGMPLCRALGNGLWEIRTSLPSSRIARTLFSVHGGHIIVLHGFIKKAQKTPESELRIARKRQKEFES